MDLMLFVAEKCADCPKAKETVAAVAKRFRELHVSVLDIEEDVNRLNVLQFRITKPPALILDGEPIFRERFPTEAELAKHIEQRIRGQETKKEGRGRGRWWSVSGLPEQWGSEPAR